ncbi:hypothetical protein PLESTF_000530400 [Pleodorina starrii]|nr:hypothetical protein PLESTF_000530400 [Pleodorina starrii]
MRAAQQYLLEGAAGKACSPVKWAPRRPTGQLQQQQRLPQLRTTVIEATPQSEANGSQSEPEAGVAAASRRGGGGAAAAAAPAVLTAQVTVAAPGPATGHRSSLGSERSCVSSGALESWSLCGTGAAGGGVEFTRAPTPPPSVISFSPLVVNALTTGASAAAPPPSGAASAAARATAGAVVVTTRFDSPTLHHEPLQLSLPQPGGANCGGSARRDAAGGRACTGAADAKPAAPQPSSAAAAWRALAAAGPAAATTRNKAPQPSHQPQHPYRLDGPGQCTVRGLGYAVRPAAAWDTAPYAPAAAAPPLAAHWGYGMSSGCNGSGDGDGGSIWTDLLGAGAATGVAAAGALHSTSKLVAAAPGARSAATVAAQLRAAATPAGPSPFGSIGLGGGSGGGGGSSSGGSSVVTMGLYGIMDEELLACLRS